MKSSPLARRQLRNHARYRGRNDLNIVPMLDVMVILAFFLIFTAVFSKTSVLEVNLPGPGAQAASKAPAFELEVIVRRGAVAPLQRPGAHAAGSLDRLKAPMARCTSITPASTKAPATMPITASDSMVKRVWTTGDMPCSHPSTA